MTKIIVIVGPTAVGKTKMGVELALKYNGEIISGDSMQIYRKMDIGTAKVTKEETKGIKHHLIDIKEFNEDYSVKEFQVMVRDCIEDISKRGKTPIIVGGTGLYIKAALFDYEFNEESNEFDETKYQKLTNEELHEYLKSIDSKSAQEIHHNNRRRVMRAIQIFENSGTSKSDIIAKQKQKLLYDVCFIGLTMNRELLYDRINNRVDIMINNGLLDEFSMLLNLGASKTMQSMCAIGYKELFELTDDNKNEIVDSIKQNSRRYAKRQYTWFKNQMDIHWINVNVDNFSEAIIDATNYYENYANFHKIAFEYNFEKIDDFKEVGIISRKICYLPNDIQSPKLFDLKNKTFNHTILLVIEYDESKIKLEHVLELYKQTVMSKFDIYSKQSWNTIGTIVRKIVEIQEI